MKVAYSNLPPDKSANSSSDATVKYFNDYYTYPVELDNSTFQAMVGFFEKRGWDKTAAEFTTSIIMGQAKKDNFNANQLLDTIYGLDSVKLSSLVAEILNYNRFKTSQLGLYTGPVLSDEVQRNIIA